MTGVDPQRWSDAFSLLDPRVMDPGQEIVSRTHLAPDEVDQVVEVLEAMNRWRDTERRMSEASRRYMKLGDNDMRALRYLIAGQRHGRVIMPRDIANTLGISPAATTKLLDRLEAGHHIRRAPHPGDRRSITIEVTDETRASARASVGRSHARRFDAVAELSAEDRAAVLRFFDALIDSAEGFDDDAVRLTTPPE